MTPGNIEIFDAMEWLRGRSTSTVHASTSKYARTLLAWIEELQLEPRLPADPVFAVIRVLEASITDAIQQSGGDLGRVAITSRGWSLWRSLREELMKPKTVKAWRVTATSPGGRPYEYTVTPGKQSCGAAELRTMGAAKSRAHDVASDRIRDDYTNVSVTEVEVPA